jgi:hypothetical protein
MIVLTLFLTGFTGFFGFSLLSALQMRAAKPQSPSANKNGIDKMRINRVNLGRDETSIQNK